MSTNFPTALDALRANQGLTDGATIITAAPHNNLMDAVDALQAKVGVNSSAVATSLDYLVTHLNTGRVRVGIGSYTGNGASNRAFTAVGWQPALLYLIDHTHASSFGTGIKTATMGAYTSFATVGFITQLIVSLDATGFTLGTNHPYVNNVDGRTYTWIAVGNSD